jgi:2-methylisocitrate lyase-like PEP mutase family enzyme
MAETPGARLRRIVGERRAVLTPGAANALAARVIEDLGFEALYLSGAGLTNTYLGLPDLAFMSLAELVEHTAVIRDVTSLPLIVDADTGFGNALNVYQAVRRLERAGANAIQIEDQVLPKRCGHFTGKQVVEAAEMEGKIRAAVDARSSADLLIVARTDARAIEGLDAAIERANRYAAAGADLLFIEAPEGVDELASLPSRSPAPQLVNMVVGGRTPIVDQAELARLGFAIVLYANTALQAAVRGMQQALGVLKATGRMDEDPALVAPFAERQRLVGKGEFDALERRYGGGDNVG